MWVVPPMLVWWHHWSVKWSSLKLTWPCDDVYAPWHYRFVFWVLTEHDQPLLFQISAACLKTHLVHLKHRTNAAACLKTRLVHLKHRTNSDYDLNAVRSFSWRSFLPSLNSIDQCLQSFFESCPTSTPRKYKYLPWKINNSTYFIWDEYHYIITITPKHTGFRHLF